MPNTIEVWAPWMQQQEATELVENINRTPRRQRLPSAKQLGKRLRLTNGERERLKLWTIAASDLTPEQARAWSKAKAKARKRRLRQSHGSKPRAEYEAASANRARPWLALGISRRTWYYRRCTSPSAVRLTSAADTLVQPEQAQPPKKRLSEGVQRSKGKAAPKAEKPKRQRQHAA